MTVVVRLIAAAALTTSCTWALAQSSPAKKELAQKIVQLQQNSQEGIIRTMAEQSVANLMQQVSAVLQTRVPADQREAKAKEIQADLKKYGEEVVPLLRDHARKLAPVTVGPVLEEKFTEDELKQIVATLENPAYKKYQTTGADMQRALMEKLVPETRPLVEPKLRALQATIGKRLGLEPPAGSASGKAAPAPKQ